ncbi:hypothetical protein MJO28_010438 [Puccinia striiformis f. sp. tritici]|uniref:Uncharacterized protein n=1 Tax=Puccinia striiformis f. sp. tritici TaxID=168172 RepID=A0ACC0E4L2_9BASI|nr:hypothetical protein MJO28_010438 [Puccinia striiformis f. sp. tritici]
MTLIPRNPAPMRDSATFSEISFLMKFLLNVESPIHQTLNNTHPLKNFPLQLKSTHKQPPARENTNVDENEIPTSK